ncbi:hypothetical protein FM113_09350 [Leucobacter sp. 7(1)]|uniref:hypothetical protein n=1 Tax=Leucobacter sp. 7(1) TaxID=1255613 RepID=UPI00097E7DA7|nr:hypothetical protein [Leucobacter sp. 7(1)]SJN10529.1 hypothetical protein FM113_09350 [Leucobacter sp. 7(1)]
MSVMGVVQRLAEDSTEFDPNQVTPGVEGFLFTGLMAAGIIALGFLLVTRLRRNMYRHEVREEIAAELGEAEADSEPRS